MFVAGLRFISGLKKPPAVRAPTCALFSDIGQNHEGPGFGVIRFVPNGACQSERD
jgi:hypothetical protein